MSASMMPTVLPQRESASEVDGDRRLANAPLASADGDDVLHAWQRGAGAVGTDGFADAGRHLHVDLRHARDLHDRRTRLIAQQILHRTRRRRELDRKGDARAVDREVLDESEAHDVAVKIRILDDLQRVENGGLFDVHNPSRISYTPRECRNRRQTGV